MDRNVTIRIGGTAPEYTVIAETNGSSAEGTFRLPFGPEELEALEEIVAGAAVRHVGTSSAYGGPRSTPRIDSRIRGAQLYEALFRGEIGRLLNSALGRAERGVRVRLLVSTAKGDASRIAALPWEILTRAPDELPLAFDRNTVLVRTIDVVDEAKPAPFVRPLRILFVASNPTGSAPLDLAKETARISAALTKEGRGIEPVLLERPTKEAILDSLAREQFHVLHFMGHGDFDETTGRGAVLLERADGTGHRVEGDELLAMLQGRGLRLVFLNACKTATTSPRAAINPFGGVATSLMRGVPAVVAMQYPITDAAAIDFATTFYNRIAVGMDVDLAVAEGRKLLFGPPDSEWATPVLYLRPQHGALFEVGPRNSGSASAAAPSAVATPAAAPPIVSTPGGSMLAVSPASASASSEFRVFLAASSAAANRGQIIAKLRAAGIGVLRAVPNPDEPDEFETTMHDALMRARAGESDLFVHILGGDRGEPLADADHDAPGDPQTFAVRQLTIGSQILEPQLVLLDDSVVVDAITDVPYREFLERIQRIDRQRGEFELRRERVSQMAVAIIDKRDRIVKERQRAAEDATRAAATTANLTAFVDVHPNDYKLSRDLRNYLEDRGVTPMMMPKNPDGGDTPDIGMFETMVRSSPAVILYYGGVDYDWITNRADIVNKIKAKQRLRTKVGVYLAPPRKSDDDLNYFEQFPVAHNMDGFDPASIDVLLPGERR